MLQIVKCFTVVAYFCVCHCSAVSCSFEVQVLWCNSQWNAESRPLFFKWLVNGVYVKQTSSVTAEVCSFFSLFTPRKLHWVHSVLDSLPKIKRIEWSFRREVCIGSRMKRAPLTCYPCLPMMLKIKEQTWLLLSHLLP